MENEINSPQPQSELYSELKEMLYEEPATVGQRFLNYVIDLILFYSLFFVYGMIAAMIGLAAGSANAEENYSTESGSDRLLSSLISILVYLFFYTTFETLTKGRTLGKMITGTRAVKSDGSSIGFHEALMRSLSRIVPFEPFSALGGNPWHDKWTGTKVIKERR